MDLDRLQETIQVYSQLAHPPSPENRRGLQTVDQVARGSRAVLAAPRFYWNSSKVSQTQVATWALVIVGVQSAQVDDEPPSLYG